MDIKYTLKQTLKWLTSGRLVNQLIGCSEKIIPRLPSPSLIILVLPILKYTYPIEVPFYFRSRVAIEWYFMSECLSFSQSYLISVSLQTKCRWC